MTAEEIADAADLAWGKHPHGRSAADAKMVVFTGGEPTLQLDATLVEMMHKYGWYVSVETNGTRDIHALGRCDHVCVSPKKGSTIVVRKAHELKVVLPGAVAGEEGWRDDELRMIANGGEWLEKYVQPQDVVNQATVGDTYLHKIRINAALNDEPGSIEFQDHVERCLHFIRDNPGWRLSWQQHKSLGLR